MTSNFKRDLKKAAEASAKKYEFYCKEKYLNSEKLVYAIEKLVISAVASYDYRKELFNDSEFIVDRILSKPLNVRGNLENDDTNNKVYTSITLNYKFNDYYDGNLIYDKIDLDLVNELLKKNNISVGFASTAREFYVTIWFDNSVLGIDDGLMKTEPIKQKVYEECKKYGSREKEDK